MICSGLLKLVISQEGKGYGKCNDKNLSPDPVHATSTHNATPERREGEGGGGVPRRSLLYFISILSLEEYSSLDLHASFEFQWLSLLSAAHTHTPTPPHRHIHAHTNSEFTAPIAQEKAHFLREVIHES